MPTLACDDEEQNSGHSNSGKETEEDSRDVKIPHVIGNPKFSDFSPVGWGRRSYSSPRRVPIYMKLLSCPYYYMYIIYKNKLFSNFILYLY